MNQWVWNTQLELGSIGEVLPLRWTAWEAGSQDAPAAPLLPESALTTDAPSAGDLVATYAELELAQPWAKARRWFSAQDFTLREDDTL